MTAFEERLTHHVRVLEPDNREFLATHLGLAYFRVQARDPTISTKALDELLAELLHAIRTDTRPLPNFRDSLAQWQERPSTPGRAAALEELFNDLFGVFRPDQGQHTPRRSPPVRLLVVMATGQTKDTPGVPTGYSTQDYYGESRPFPQGVRNGSSGVH